MSSLHDTDFYSWTQQQAALLRAGNIASLDIDNIIEEIEDMGRSEKRSLRSCLRVLLMHLLKWQYEPQRRSKSWHVTIVTQRSNITEILEDSPGLKSLIQIVIATAYPKARKEAAAETGLQLA
ncbi:hypothetical protein TI05_19625, partial [Achromatium sp. WMS3]